MKKSTMIKTIIKTIYFIYVFFMTSFGEVYSVEWDCASTTNEGTFTRSTDCTISGTYVDVSNTLAINGTITDMNVICHLYVERIRAPIYLLKIM